MIISLGDKFINMDSVTHIEDGTTHLPIVTIYFIGKKGGLHLSGDYAEKVLTYLERTAEKPMRRKRLSNEKVIERNLENLDRIAKSQITVLELGEMVGEQDVSQMSFKEIQERGLTLGEYQDALSKSKFGR